MEQERLRNAIEALKRGGLRLIEKGWTQYAFARLPDGKSVPATHPEAVCYCARGALHCERVPTASPEVNTAAWDANTILEEALNSCANRSDDFSLYQKNGVTLWNDSQSRTREHVLYVYAEAIKLGEARFAARAA